MLIFVILGVPFHVFMSAINLHFCHFLQVSTSRGIGLVIGPAVGGFFAMVGLLMLLCHSDNCFLPF